MYILKNALKSITRTKVRNILIGIIITIIALSCCVALSIKNSAVKLIESYQNSYEVEATLSLNRDSMRQSAKTEATNSGTSAKDFMASLSQLDVATVVNYGTSDYVKSYNYNIQTEMNSTSIEKATTEDTTTNSTTQQEGMKRPDELTTQTSTKVKGDFEVVGYSSLDGMSEFVNSEYKITSGTMFDINATNNPCVISTDLADQNSLTVGSTITMVNPNNESETYTFTVVGIYEDTTESTEFSMFSNAANKILTNYNSLNTIVTNSANADDTKLTARTNATFILNSADVVDAFTSELTSKGMSSYYTVSTNIDSLDSAIEPLQNLSNFANVFLIIVLSIGGVILVVINMINIRERKYEIGVLRAIGMKKHKVLSQFVIELFIVTIISLMIGTTVGAFLTVPIANNMLASEISSQAEAQTEVSSNFGGGGPQMGGGGPSDIRNTFSNTDVEYVDKINAIIDGKTILELLGIGVLLTIISSSISMISISRYTPLKILSNRT